MVRSGGSRFVRLVTGAVVAAVLLSACDSWKQVGFSAHHRRHNAGESRFTVENLGTLTEAWSTTLDGSITEPVLDEGRIYVGVSEGTAPTATAGAVAFDADSGAELWRHEADYSLAAGTTVSAVATPVALTGDDTLQMGGFVELAPGNCPHFVRRIDPDDGTLQSWGEGLFKSAMASSGELTAATAMSTSPSCPDPSGFGLISLMVGDQTGNALWWTHSFAERGDPQQMPAPAMGGGLIFVTHGSKLSAFVAAGCGQSICDPVWTVEVGDNPVDPVVGTDGTVFTASDGTLLALDPTTGSTRWTAPASGAQGIAYANGFVFAAGDATGAGGPLLAYPAAGGGSSHCPSPTWQANDTRSATSAPAVAGGAVYIGVENGVLVYDVDGCGASDCGAITEIPVSGAATHVTIGQGRLVVAGSDPAGQGTARLSVFETAAT
jgi:outer membrane protein assembly factor BamB